MKKLFFLSVLISTSAFSQITDENGNNAVDSNNSSLSGNVGIGITPSSSSAHKLEVNGSVQATKATLTHSLPDGTVFTDWTDRAKKSLLFTAGTLVDVNAGVRTFNYFEFPSSNLTSSHSCYLAIEDKNYKSRLRFLAETDGTTDFLLFGKNQTQYFYVQDDGNSNVFMHLPKANSRFVIAGYGDYLPQHKFIVRNGSALIEGDMFSTGNVGIGTTTPDEKLAVNGNIHTKEVRVDLIGWSDFVFENDYKLPTLQEVEQHIKENGHLQNIPSAKEVEEHGILLGDMNAKLLQKIEELTLYTIEQEKKIIDLKKKAVKVDVLEDRLKRIEKSLELKNKI